MSKRYGLDSFVGVGKESTWGTIVARTDFLEMQGESGGHQPGRTEIPTWRSRVVPAYFDVGKKSLKSYTFPLTFEGLLEFLRNAMWGYASTSFDAGARIQHTFTMGNTKAAPLTIEGANSEANATIYAGCFLRKLTIEGSATESARMSIDFVSKGEQSAAKTGSPTFPLLSSLLIRPNQIAATIDGAGTFAELDNFSVSIDTGIDEGRSKLRGNSDIIEPEPLGRATITGSIARDWNDAGLYNKLISGASFSLAINCTGAVLGTGTYQFIILVNQAIIDGDPPSHGGPGIVSETINWKAQHDATNTGCKITVMNAEPALV